MSELRHLAHRMAEAWKREGVLRFLYRGSAKILKPLVHWRIAYIYAGDLTRPLPPVITQGEFEVRLYSGPECLQDLLVHLPKMLKIRPETIEARLKRGDWVSIAYSGGEAVAFQWAATDPRAVAEMEPTLQLGTNEMFQYNAYTLLEWRGRGIIRALSVAMLGYGQQRGCIRTLSSVQFEVAPSHQASRRMGKERIQTVLTVQFRGMNSSWTRVFGSRRLAQHPSSVADP